MNEHIGNICKEIREAQGLSVMQVKDMAGLSRQAVYRLEETGASTIYTVERVLGVMGYELEVVPKRRRS